MNAAPLLCLLGPTAVGKTALALALASRWPCRLISVDSAQVYRGLDIGTAKPDAATLARYPHALIDLLPPEESYSAARFVADARAELAAARAAGQIPLLVGGSMLYFHALFGALDDLPPSRPEIRNRLLARPGPELHAELQRIDPTSAARLAPNDVKRLSRFLELWEITGRPPSQLFAAQTPPPPGRVLALGLNRERAELHQRIAARLQEMLAAGFWAEVEGLLARPGLTLAHPSLQSAGYQQLGRALLQDGDRAEAEEQALIATRQLAKRQITWMNNRLKTVLPLEIHRPDPPGLIDRVAAFLAGAP